ncbi:hypothetical protein TWF718_007652 [Orbilia javanica]|uniref:Uncharacterized protein n=1 Tax=Orbilia javanica TaxID=47235 RepID=A0AAN8RIL4_9PEZI
MSPLEPANETSMDNRNVLIPTQDIEMETQRGTEDVAFASNTCFESSREDGSLGMWSFVSAIPPTRKGLRFGDDSAAFTGIKIATALRNPSMDRTGLGLIHCRAMHFRLQGFPSKQGFGYGTDHLTTSREGIFRGVCTHMHFRSKRAGRCVGCIMISSAPSNESRNPDASFGLKEASREALKTPVKLQMNLVMPIPDWTFHAVVNVGPLRETWVSNSPSLNGPRTKRNVGKDLGV